MLRAPIWSMSAYSLTSGTCSGDMTSVTTGSPVSRPGGQQDLQALFAQALEAVGRWCAA